MEKIYGKWKADGLIMSEFSKQRQRKLKCLQAELSGRNKPIWGTETQESTSSGTVTSKVGVDGEGGVEVALKTGELLARRFKK